MVAKHFYILFLLRNIIFWTTLNLAPLKKCRSALYASVRNQINKVIHSFIHTGLLNGFLFNFPPINLLVWFVQ